MEVGVYDKSAPHGTQFISQQDKYTYNYNNKQLIIKPDIMANNILADEHVATQAYFNQKKAEYIPETAKIANEVTKLVPVPNYIFLYLTNTIKNIITDTPPTISIAGISSADIDDIVEYIETPASPGKFTIYDDSKLHKKYGKIKEFTKLLDITQQVSKIYKFVMCFEYLCKVRCMIDNTTNDMQIPESIAANIAELYNCIVCLINPILTKIQFAVDNMKQNKEYDAKSVEQSKQLMEDILIPEAIEKIQGLKDQSEHAIPVIPITPDDNYMAVDSITLPEINYNLNKNALKRTVGLTTIDIYNIVKASHNLPVKFPKLSRTTLNNQFMIYIRTAKFFSVYIEDLVDSTTAQQGASANGGQIDWNAINWKPKYITREKGVPVDDDESPVLEEFILSIPMLRFKFINELAVVSLTVNAIINIEYRGDLAELHADVKRAKQEYEASKIDPTITPIRYYIVPASTAAFTNSFFTEVGYNISGAHKVSIVFDLEYNKYMFYEPFSTQDQHILLPDGTYVNGVIRCLYKLLHATGKQVYFRDYSALDLYIDVNIQSYEHIGVKRSDKLIINSRRKKIYNSKLIKEYNDTNNELYKDYENKNRDFAFGYCGLWNYLLAFILMVNPNHTVYNVFYMFYLIFHTEEYAFNFTKALIRSFANHIENMLDCKIEYIPLVKITRHALLNIREQTGPTKPPGTIIDYITNRIKYVEREPHQLTAYKDITKIPQDTYFSNPEMEYLEKNKLKPGKTRDMVPSYAIWPIFKDIASSLAQSIGFKKRCMIKHANTANTLYANYMTGKEKLIMFVSMADTGLEADQDSGPSEPSGPDA
jgi:hypothetical protein